MLFGRQQSSTGTRWIESVVITAAAPILGSLVAPDDPYLLRAAFPWLMLAPLAVGLQHGLWAGLFSSGLLCAGALWQSLSAGALPADFTSFCIGCAVVALVAGQVRDSVRARSEQLRLRAEELQDRLERSERTRHVIQLSHAKLAERVASGRSSLAAAIEGAAKRMGEARSMQDLGQVLLEVLATQGTLHAASLYIASREVATLVLPPVASFGGTGESAAQHPLVVRAFRTGKLAAIVDAGELVSADKSVLAAVPLITSQRETVGVVAVHQLPFMAFHAEHLNQLFVLAGHLADMLLDHYRELTASPQAPVPAPEPVSPPLTASNDTPEIEIIVTEEAEETELVEKIDPAPAPVVIRAPAIQLPPPKAVVKVAAVVELREPEPEPEPEPEIVAEAAPVKPAVADEPADPNENPITRALRRTGRLSMPAPAATETKSEPKSRDDVTQTRAVDHAARNETSSEDLRPTRHVTRSFPSPFRFPKPAAPTMPESAPPAPRVRAQAKIRAQVAEAAARRSTSL